MHLRIKESVSVILILLLSTVSSFSQLNRARTGDVSKKTVASRDHDANERSNAKDRFWQTAKEGIKKASELRKTRADGGWDVPSGASSIVTNLNDSGPGSLRQAMLDAVEFSSIEFDPSLVGTIQLTSGSLLIDRPMAILGPGPRLIQIDGTGLSSGSVFVIGTPEEPLPGRFHSGLAEANSKNRGFGDLPVTDVFISGLSITGGKGTLAPVALIQENPKGAIYKGGGIYANLTPIGVSVGLTIVDCEIKDNGYLGKGVGVTEGGGLYLRGFDPVIIYKTTFSGNVAENGGGVFIGETGTTAIFNTTFTDNSAIRGGAIYRSALNSVVGTAFTTIAQNEVFYSGGGIFAEPIITMGIRSQIDGTLVTDPETGAFLLYSTIVADNLAFSEQLTAGGKGGFQAMDLDGVFFAEHSLIGTVEGSAGITDGVSGNIAGSLMSPLDPKLGPLENNGGLTDTMALDPTSPAIDAGLDSNIVNFIDQRGALRPWYPTMPDPFPSPGDGSDIGAFEYNFTTAAGASVSGRISDHLGRSISGAQVAVTDTETGVTTTIRTNQFGRYSVKGLTSGRVYVVSVSSKSSKDKPVQILNLAESLGEINFTLSRR